MTSTPFATALAPLPTATGVAAPTGLPEGSDEWCVAYWLLACASKSPHTRRAYQREAGRWLAFLAALRGIQPPSPTLLGEATYEDAQRFVAWIQDEALPDLPEWAAHQWGVSAKRPKASNTVMQKALVILHGMYEELSKAMVGRPLSPAVALNPFKPWRSSVRATTAASAADSPDAPGVAKALSREAWEVLWNAACTPPAADMPLKQQRLHARRRLALAALRATWERRAAIARLTWADVRPAQDGTWKTRRMRKGKGAPTWEPVPPSFLQELRHFRAACSLPQHPSEAELHRSIYWCGDHAGADGPINPETFYQDIKALLRIAADNAATAGRADIAAELLRSGAGPHTIRHTMATQWMQAGGDARRAQEILGHSSLTVTTGIYDTRTAKEVAAALQEQWSRSETEVEKT